MSAENCRIRGPGGSSPPPPPPADPVVELEKRYASSRSATDAKALLALLEPKLATAALADRPTLARRIGDLWKVTTALREWGDRWNTNGLGAPTIEMVDARSGRPVVLALVDAETGEPVPRERARLRPGPAASPAVKRLLGETR